MADRSYTDADKALLKECYILAERFERSEDAKEMIRARSGELRVSPDYLDAFSEISYGDTEMTIISGIMEALSRQPIDDMRGQDNYGMDYALAGLPETAEREYALAILALRNGRGTSQRLEAIRHLSTAISYDHSDPRFRALADILSEID